MKNVNAEMLSAGKRSVQGCQALEERLSKAGLLGAVCTRCDLVCKAEGGVPAALRAPWVLLLLQGRAPEALSCHGMANSAEIPLLSSSSEWQLLSELGRSWGFYGAGF